MKSYSLKYSELTTPTHPKSEASPPPKSEHIELVPIEGAYLARLTEALFENEEGASATYNIGSSLIRTITAYTVSSPESCGAVGNGFRKICETFVRLLSFLLEHCLKY